MTRKPRLLVVLSLCGVIVAPGLPRAQAPGSPAPGGTQPSIVHPIYAHQPDAPFNDIARKVFAAAADRYKLQPLEVIDIVAPAPSQAGEAIKVGKEKMRKLAFDEALKALEPAAVEAVAAGGAGLSTSELSDLYLYRGMAVARADWKPERSVDDATAARGYADYVRAVVLTPTRALNPRETPPQVMADWARALAEVRGRPRGTLTVRGPADATLSLDGDAPAALRGGATFKDLVYGEHFLRVEEVGRAPWGTVITLAAPQQDVEVPARAELVLDDAVAGAHARRMGAKFALVAEVKLGAPELALELRLVDISGIRHDSVVISLAGAERGVADAAVMRMDEQARRIDHMGLAPSLNAGDPGVAPADATPALLSTTPARATLNDDPAAWARDHWPLLTAVGVVVGAAVVLGLSVAADRPTR